jgi:hypothetical protein
MSLGHLASDEDMVSDDLRRGISSFNDWQNELTTGSFDLPTRIDVIHFHRQ